MTKLSVRDLHLNYEQNPILKGVSFDLAAGQVVSLLGASGSGKTTLLRAIAGLEQPSAGQILLDGRPLYDASAGCNLAVEQRSLGLVFQSYALWPHRTVAQNVGYGLKLRQTPTAEIAARVRQILDKLGLGHLAERYPHQLSGGQQQRVAIARALVYNPPVILLDEPLSNLDAKLREEARAWLRELIVSMNLSALCVTHDQSEAMAMSDQILLLKNGRIEQAGSPTDLYSAPASLYTAQFMGANNTLRAKVAARNGDSVTLQGEGWQLRATARQALEVGQQAEAVIRLERLRVQDEPGGNSLPARLIASMYLGDRWEYLLQHGDLRLRAFGQQAKPNGECWAEFGLEDTWAFEAASA
ncbi:lipase [Chromobacterium sp. Panama]|uniref:ABC transporter ATP-binding protein n=1 Tax=Chromobacterium sp. Panama TaxID=2161826 RepID=UPI000D3187AE|nr:ABC transporter ATP-binding protein [Chromobacterium sp. Panama]PTU64152.1 lipase [Chromobacterium sp. Panama]